MSVTQLTWRLTLHWLNLDNCLKYIAVSLFVVVLICLMFLIYSYLMTLCCINAFVLHSYLLTYCWLYLISVKLLLTAKRLAVKTVPEMSNNTVLTTLENMEISGKLSILENSAKTEGIWDILREFFYIRCYFLWHYLKHSTNWHVSLRGYSCTYDTMLVKVYIR